MKFEQIYTGEWNTVKRKETIECCDCSLVHKVRFRVRDGELQAQVQVDNRMTAARRRALGIKVTKGNRKRKAKA